MIWGAIRKKGKLPLLFTEKGVKIDKNYYLQKVLKSHMIKVDQRFFKKDPPFTFQQNSAPSHKAKGANKIVHPLFLLKNGLHLGLISIHWIIAQRDVWRVN